MTPMGDYQKLIMIDLDNTLLDNQEIRMPAVKNALEELPIQANPRSVMRMYHAFIHLNAAFEFFGFSNFRHEWNTPAIYSALVAFFNSPSREKPNNHKKVIFDSLVEINDHVLEWKKVHASYSHTLITEQFYEKYPLLKPFVRDVRYYSEADCVRKAVARFDKDVRYSASPAVVEFLNILEREGISAYLVTEGLTAVQEFKLDKLGLTRRFRDRVLTTEDASESGIAKDLRRLVKSAELEIKDDSPSNHRRMELLSLFYFQNLLHRLSDKSNIQFYGAILHAIRSNPLAPQKVIKRLPFVPKSEWDKMPESKIGMIGDRYDKDIYPLVKLLGARGVLTVWLKNGKYKNMITRKGIDPLHAPAFVLQDLSTVGSVLCSKKNWEQFQPLKWIKIFNEPPGADIRLFINYAKRSKHQKVQRIARIIESEMSEL